MRKFEELLQKEKVIWVEVERKNAKEFLKTAKTMNFKWLNGKNIDFENDRPFFHLSLESDKTLSNVAIFAWLSPKTKLIKRLSFKEFKNMTK